MSSPLTHVDIMVVVVDRFWIMWQKVAVLKGGVCYEMQWMIDRAVVSYHGAGHWEDDFPLVAAAIDA